ncbi:MAG: ATP-binding protein [Methylobacter sp.]|nr:MAG: ATP-binding protein [Methylobacter sp.]
MLTTLAINNYRSLLDLTVPLGRLNLVTGANGSGKSNLYRALRLLADTAQGGVVNSLAREGGLNSCFWAGPESLSKAMRKGDVPVQGGPRQKVVRLRLGFSTEEFGYAISLGLPTPSHSAFRLDPEIKRECIWAGPVCRPASVLVDRDGSVVKVREGRQWQVVYQHLQNFSSVFDQATVFSAAPELFTLRETIRSWRFYDHFRTDQDAPARKPQLGTRTPVLHHDGRDLAAALQTILEIGDHAALQETLEDAFPGAKLMIESDENSYFAVKLSQYGLLRPLSSAELSDGTLRYLFWIAALLTPRPPMMMVLNEPETSLHPDLLPALARLIIKASQNSQIWVVTHALPLIAALSKALECEHWVLEKNLGQTVIEGQDMLSKPAWRWID